MRHILHTWTGMIEPELRSWRRDLHQMAEVGFCEYVTTYYIYQKLKDLNFSLYIGQDALDSNARYGVPTDQVLREHEERALEQGVPEDFLDQIRGGHTGVVATLDTGKPGKHMAFRFDIDALPIVEADEIEHIPSSEGFRSLNEGMMHACGHDGHTAIGLGLARFIYQHQDQLTGSFTLLFQPAEEGSRGANAMVQKGWLDNVDLFLSGHLGIQPLPVGTVVAASTSILATTKIDVSITGQTAHAGMSPHEGRNALIAGSAMVLALHGIAPHGDGVTRINVGRMEGGSGRNIVPGEAFLQLETRGTSTRENAYMKEEAIRRIEGAAQMYGVNVNYSIVGEGISAETDDYWRKQIPLVLAKSTVVKQVQSELALNGSEDVTYMMRRVQDTGGAAAYLIYGTPLAAGHHHRRFDYDESTLAVAVNALAYLICAESGEGALQQ